MGTGDLGKSFVRNGSWTERFSVPDILTLNQSPRQCLCPFLLQSFCFGDSVSGFAFSAGKCKCVQLSSSSFCYISFFYLFSWDNNGKTISLRSIEKDIFHPSSSAFSDLRHALINVNMSFTDGKFLGCCPSANWLLGRKVYFQELSHAFWLTWASTLAVWVVMSHSCASQENE